MGFLLDFVAWAVGGVLSLVVAMVCPPLTWMAANPLTTVATGAVVALALWLRSKSNRELLLGGGRRRLKVEAPAGASCGGAGQGVGRLSHGLPGRPPVPRLRPRPGLVGWWLGLWGDVVLVC